jgi:hypothetical protein
VGEELVRMVRIRGNIGGAGAVILAALTWALAAAPARAQTPAAGSANAPDTTLEVPFNGTYWQTMPNFTWAACDVSKNTRKAIDLAIGQWTYAAANQGMPIRLTEVPCTSGNSRAQIKIFEASASDLPGTPDRDVFGLTEAMDAKNKGCGVDVTGPCVALSASVFLFTDNWEVNGLTYAQAAKTIAHELGHAIGLGHAHFCNFDSIMAQSCEPLLSGLGPDDVQSIDALVDVVRTYFNLPLIRAQPQSPVPTLSNSILYHTGYNLVSGPRGTSFGAAAGPLYTMVPGDTSYRSIPAGQPTYDALGYWAYFAQDTTVQLSGSGSPFYSAIAPPGQWFLIGNESGTSPMRVVVGAQSVFLYDAPSGQYKASDTIPAGQAAWVRVGKDGFVAVAATSLTRDQVNCYLNLGSPTSC